MTHVLEHLGSLATVYFAVAFKIQKPNIYIYIYTVVIKKVVPSKYCNISVTWVISMHQRAWCVSLKCTNICIARRKC